MGTATSSSTRVGTTSFSHDTKDPAWLAEAGTREWVVITRDKKIRTRPAERRAIVKKNVGAFIIAQRQPLARWDVLKIVVGNLDEIERLFAETPRPFIFTITSVGIRPYA